MGGKSTLLLSSEVAVELTGDYKAFDQKVESAVMVNKATSLRVKDSTQQRQSMSGRASGPVPSSLKSERKRHGHSPRRFL